jgi:hypothetical protein
MSDKVLITILRRDESELLPYVVDAIRAKFPDKEVVFKRTDPEDHLKHAEQCDELVPAAIYLPEKPIPSLAMEKGFQHIIVTCEGEVMELEPLQPKFKPFEPK